MSDSLKRKMAIGTVLLALSNILSRVLGLGRDWLLARAGGASFETDAFNISFLLPDLLNHFLGAGMLSATLIPLITPALQKDDTNGASEIISRIFGVVFPLVLILSIFAFIFAPELIPWLSETQLDPVVLERATHFTRILIFAQVAFVGGGFFNAMQYGRFSYTVPALAPLIYNSSIIIGGLVSWSQGGLDGFCYGALGGAFVGNFSLQFWGAWRQGLRLKPRWMPSSQEFKTYLFRTLPFIFGASVTFFVEFSFRYFGGSGEGDISSLGFGWRIAASLIGIFGGAVGIASFPQMSRLCADGNYDELGQMMASTLEKILALLIPSIIIISALAEPAVQFYLMGGKFDIEAATRVANALRIFLVAALPMTAILIVNRAYYADGRTWMPSVISMVLLVLSWPMYSWLEPKVGFLKVPWGAVIFGYGLLSILLTLWIRKHPSRAFGRVAVSLFKILALGTGLYFLSRWWGGYISWQGYSKLGLGVYLFASGGALLVISLLGLGFLRISSVNSWIQSLKGRILRR